MTLDSQTTSATIYKQLFTDAEWDAISSALNDYQDYGNEEAMIADSIQAKIAAIYRLTSNWFFLMQLTSKRHSMVVEFRPHSILTDKFVYTLKFKGETQSMRLFNKKEMIETVNSRLDIHGYEVTDFLTEPQQYMPASCWGYVTYQKLSSHQNDTN